MRTDAAVWSEVVEVLNRDPHLGIRLLGVAVSGGVVTLSGTVARYVEKWAVEHVVERVSGVTRVASSVTVSLPHHEVRTDDELTDDLHESLHRQVQLPGTDVTVIVSDGWVRLDGCVQWNFQKDAAEHIVRDTIGVRGITNSVSVEPVPGCVIGVQRRISEVLRGLFETAADTASHGVEHAP